MLWLVPALVVVWPALVAVPLGRYMARLFDRPRPANRIERWLDTGPQTWKRYSLNLLGFNTLVYVLGYVVLVYQHVLPLNPDGKPALAPSTVFNTACSYLTNTNLQHYAGEVHLSHLSQLTAVLWKQFVTPVVGLSALLAVIRGLRGDSDMGNVFIDLWRGTVGVFLPLALVVGGLLVLGGVPMSVAPNVKASPLDGGSQEIALGPVAGVVAIKQLGTNGGGHYATNSSHPFENPSVWTNLLECGAILLVPMACVVMFGRMLKAERHALVLFTVCGLLLVTLTIAGVLLEAQPNPGLAGLPVDQRAGNLEGKELRFGAGSAGAWAAVTTCTSNGSVNCMHDSLNPLTALVPLTGLWLNCIYGGVGIGLVNLLVFLVMAVFLAGLMVGRTPEYLGKKVEAREMKLAMLALLIHPMMVLAPTGLFCQMGWADASKNNPGPHGFTETLYEFSSASANNGSGFEGLVDTVGVRESDDPELKDESRRADRQAVRKVAVAWDVSTGLVMVFCRFIPIIAPIALAAGLARKRPTPFTAGTLRTDTATFGMVLLVTVLLVGALLFLPAAALGPVAEHLSFK